MDFLKLAVCCTETVSIVRLMILSWQFLYINIVHAAGLIISPSEYKIIYMVNSDNIT